MKYDFTTVWDRRGNDSAAVDGVGVYPGFPTPPKEGFDFIPMSVADMNFATCPAIPEAIKKRLEHPLFGYFFPRQEYFDAIIRWQKTRHNVDGLTAECIGFENGVHGGNCAALRVFCSRGDRVLLNTPAYASFIRNLKDLGYNAVTSPMYKDENGVWRMDFEDMEKKIIENKIHAVVFCSPHNPTGRVWERWELESAMDIFRRHDVMVLSDEIWADIVFEGHRHIPTQSISEDARNRTIAMYAPTKTFNIAGLVGSYHIVYNKLLRDRMDRESILTHYNNMNLMAMHALIAAYSDEGNEWVDELCQTLHENAKFAHRYVCEHFEGVDVSMPEGTYMLFLDCREWCEKHNKTLDELLTAGYDVGVGWQDGRPFGGEHHIRMNLALPRSRVEEAFARLTKYAFVG